MLVITSPGLTGNPWTSWQLYIITKWLTHSMQTDLGRYEHPVSYLFNMTTLWSTYELPMNYLWTPMSYLWPPSWPPYVTYDHPMCKDELPMSYLRTRYYLPVSYLWSTYEHRKSYLWVTLTFKRSSYGVTIHDQTDDFHRVMIFNLVRSSRTPKVHQCDHKIISLNRLNTTILAIEISG